MNIILLIIAIFFALIALVIICGYYGISYFCQRHKEARPEEDSGAWNDGEGSCDYEHEKESRPKFMATGCYNVLIPTMFHSRKAHEWLENMNCRDMPKFEEIPPGYDSNSTKPVWHIPLKGGLK